MLDTKICDPLTIASQNQSRQVTYKCVGKESTTRYYIIGLENKLFRVRGEYEWGRLKVFKIAYWNIDLEHFTAASMAHDLYALVKMPRLKLNK